MPITYKGTGTTKHEWYSQPIGGAGSPWSCSISFSSGDVPGAAGDWIVWVRSSRYGQDFSSVGGFTYPDGVTRIAEEVFVTTGAAGRGIRRLEVFVGRRSALTFPAVWEMGESQAAQGYGLFVITPMAFSLAGYDPDVQVTNENVGLLPYGQSPIAVDREALVVSAMTHVRATAQVNSVGFLFGQDTPAVVSSITMSAANLAPGQGATYALDDTPTPITSMPYNRVRPGDRIMVMIEASGTDVAKTFNVTATGGGWTRIVQHTISSRRMELWRGPVYDGEPNDWVNWDKIPTVTATGGTGTTFRAAMVVGRGALTGPGFGQPSWAHTWASTATPNFPTGTMPTLSSTSYTIGMVSFGNSPGWTPGPRFNAGNENGWGDATYNVLPRMAVATRFGGAGTAPAPGFGVFAAVGDQWSWIGLRATRVANFVEPGPVEIDVANGFALRHSSTIYEIPAGWPFTPSDAWREHAVATRIVAAPGGLVTPPVWGNGDPAIAGGDSNLFVTCALYAVPVNFGVYRDGRLHAT